MSICQRIMLVVGLPSGFTPTDYWIGVAQSLASDKLCAMRSNIYSTILKRCTLRYHLCLNIGLTILNYILWDMGQLII
jgi:hypothetical protein